MCRPGYFDAFTFEYGKLRKLTENYVVSNAKIKAALGIDKLPVTAKEGLMKTIRSFEETNNLCTI